MKRIQLALFATALAGVIIVGSAKAAGILLLGKAPSAVCFATNGQTDLSFCSNSVYTAILF